MTNNPYAASAESGAQIPRPAFSAEAQEYPALRRFHYVMLILGLLKLIFCGLSWMNLETTVASLVRATGRHSNAQREALTAQLTQALERGQFVDLAMAVILIVCAFTVFHFPRAATLTGLMLHLCYVLVLWVFIAPAMGAMGLSTVLVPSAVLVVLTGAVITAFKFYGDYTRRHGDL